MQIITILGQYAPGVNPQVYNQGGGGGPPMSQQQAQQIQLQQQQIAMQQQVFYFFSIPMSEVLSCICKFQ